MLGNSSLISNNNIRKEAAYEKNYCVIDFDLNYDGLP